MVLLTFWESIRRACFKNEARERKCLEINHPSEPESHKVGLESRGQKHLIEASRKAYECSFEPPVPTSLKISGRLLTKSHQSAYFFKVNSPSE